MSIKRPIIPHRDIKPKIKRVPTKVTIDRYLEPITLVFNRKFPRIKWVVPAITVPFYWFDMMMLRKGLIERVNDTTFVCDGRRFIVVGQDWHIVGRGITRWLVYEEPPTGVGVP